MSTRSIECQIARGQISRYLGGDSFSPEALAQLEDHVSGCPDCKQHLNERKTTLQNMLGKPQSPAIADRNPVPEAKSPAPSVSAPPAGPVTVPMSLSSVPGMLKMVQAMFQPGGDKPAQPATWKPIAYSVALALVLGAMSLASRNMDRLMGPKASEKTASVSADADSDQPAKQKASAKKLALKPLRPLEDAEDDAAKAARAARNAVLSHKAKVRANNLTKHAAQRMPAQSQYKAEPAPKLLVAGRTPKAQKPVAKHRTAPAKMLLIESRPQRHSRPDIVHASKRHIVKKKSHKPKATSSQIRVYAP